MSAQTREENAAEMAHDAELAAEREAHHQQSRWKCPACGSLKVQIALPAWFSETWRGGLCQTGVDDEALPIYWSCDDCSESGDGAPIQTEEIQL